MFGRGWETFECERPQNLIIHSSVDYLEGINILCNSKVVLNIPPLFRNGIHDRVLSAMLCGAACVSERSLYQEEQFTDKETICFYDVKHIDKLPSIINHLLQNANEAETIINKAKKIAEKNHTWKNRALTILEQSEAILIDRSRKISE